MSSVTAHDFNSIYRQRNYPTAFKEAGATGPFPINAITILSSISLEKPAIYAISLKKMQEMAVTTPSDDELLKLVAAEVGRKCFQAIYRSPYPMVPILLLSNAIRRTTLSLPDFPVDAELKYKDNLINAYDNSIRYIQIIFCLVSSGCYRNRMLMGKCFIPRSWREDIFDDRSQLSLHASPVPSYQDTRAFSDMDV